MAAGRRECHIEMSSASRDNGPRLVALGGGHGLAALLRAARPHADELVGIVSVADDGGSSGRIRRELGLPAPGDLRRCLSALADDDSLLADALEYRFESGPLEGHAVGNLLIAGLAGSSGDFAAAIDEVSRLVGVRGEIYPATVGPVTLVADSDKGLLRGQVTIERATGIRNLRFDPPNPTASPLAVKAVLEADKVFLGPGSLFTSVLATVMVPELKSAFLRTGAQRIFIANIANDKAEARGFDLAAHVQALEDHGISPDLIIAPVGSKKLGNYAPEVAYGDFAAADGWGHDPKALGVFLASL
jgi:uncharacterized cofD-like protein